MSFEKPWAKPFRALLEEFAGYCGGEIKEPDFPSGATCRSGDLNYYAYPVLDTTYGSLSVTIEIGESPVGPIRYGMSTIEYLRLLVSTPTRYNVVVRKEGIFRKYLKLLGVEREFQTGQTDFDRRYFVKVSSEVDKGFMRLGSTQEYVRQLEPFEAVQIFSEGLRWAQEIRRKSQFTYAALHEHLQRLVMFAKAITTSG